MTRHTGLPRDDQLRAADQLQKPATTVGVQPLPAGAPGRVTGAQVGIHDPGSPLRLFVFGDSGGVQTPSPQMAVSYAMRQRQTGIAFALQLGDIVYFNADRAQYVPQFFEPYAKLSVPIVAFPGNHDGDVTDVAGRAPLDTYMAYWCTPTPAAPDIDPGLEYGRDTQTLPWCDWTLELDAVTIVAIYTNVPSGGSLEPQQTTWLATELGAAATDKPLIVGLHHPPLSVDAFHGGSATMGSALDEAFQTSGRVPDLVLSGHVHDYQRFTRQIGTKAVPYIVSGNGGYHNLHQLAADAQPGLQVTTDVTFEFGDDSHYGFLELTVADGAISGEYVAVTPGTMPDGTDATVTDNVDTFSTGAAPAEWSVS